MKDVRLTFKAEACLMLLGEKKYSKYTVTMYWYTLVSLRLAAL